MRRAIVVGVVLILLAPTPAHAWSNGPNGAEGPDTFGTHDWILLPLSVGLTAALAMHSGGRPQRG